MTDESSTGAGAPESSGDEFGNELRLLHAILDNISEAIVACDAAGRLIMFNRSARQLYGAPDQLLEFKDYPRQYSLYHAELHRPLLGSELPLARALASPDEVHEVRFGVGEEEGHRVSMVAHAQAIRSTIGELIGAVSVARDVTAAERAAAEVRSSEERYGAARDAALDAFMVLEAVRDESGRMTDVVCRDANAQAEVMLGTSAGGLIGLRYAEIFPGMVRGDHFDAYARVLESGIAEEHEFASPFHDGERWIHRRIIRLGDGVVVNARDVTERRRMEAARADLVRLEAVEVQFRTIAEAIPQIVWTARPDGHVDYYNERWFEYTGMTLEQTVGWGWEPVIHPDDLQLCVQRWTDSIATGASYEIEYRFLRASDGAYRWHLGRALPVRDAAGTIIKWFGTSTDIHEQKEANEELERRVTARTSELQAATEAAESARELAEAANRAKSEFLSRMSHELRTPLNSIIGFAGVLQRAKHSSLALSDARYLARIRSNGEHLLGLINNVLDLAKVEAGHIELVWSRFDVDVLVEDVCATLAEQASGGDVRLECHCGRGPVELTAMLRADEQRLRQVLLNLIGNAIKFTPAGGNVTVCLSTDPVSGYPLRLDVQDTGIGIPEGAQRRIFEAFEQAESGTTARYGGTGLGLPISRALCEAMGFRVFVQSEAGEGSTFSISFDRRMHQRERDAEALQVTPG